MATQPNRATVILDSDTMELLRRLQNFTKLSPAQTIQKILPAHLQELHAYLTWLEQLPKDKSLQADLGPYLLHGYGPETLIEGIKKLDPTYQPTQGK